MNIFTFVIIVLIVYTISNIFLLSKQKKQGNQIMDLLGVFDQPETFFTKANEILESEVPAITKEKTKVLKLWGEAFYDKDEDFKKSLEEIEITQLLVEAKNPVEANEDAFYYLCMAIPNNFYSKKKFELMDLLDKKIDEHKDILEKQLVYAIGKENQKFYKGQDDLGKTFLEKVIEGDYAGYMYSKQLIGLYKNVVSAVLACIYKNEGNEEKLKEQYPFLEVFVDSAAGRRMINELGVELPSEDKKEEETEEEAE